MRREPLPTHRVNAALPMNTKYLTGNPVSRRLIGGFMGSLISMVSTLELSSVLEVGCGEGLVLRQLDNILPGLPMIGLDVDAELLNAAKAILPHAAYIEGSIYSLPLPTRSYDVVVCTEVLEHLEEPHTALQEVARVAGRYCLFSVPHEPWWRFANMVRGSYWSNLGNTPGHVNHWTDNSFVHLVGRYFDILEVRRPFPWTMVLATVRSGQ